MDRSPQHMERKSIKPIAQEMREYAAHAVAAARDQGCDLDYSEESIKRVEEILTALYDATPRGFLNHFLGRTPTQKQLMELALIWGGYVGEVMRRIDGGYWTTQSLANAGGVVLHLRTGDTTPIHMVYKFLLGGPGNSVWQYVRTTRKLRAEGSS